MRRQEPHKWPQTPEGFDALWRPSPDFIGPVGPPMWLWIRDREKQAAWARLVNLTLSPSSPPAWT